MVTLNEQQRKLVEESADQPVPFVDEQSRKVYYLISEQQFERLRPLLAEDDFTPREMYPLIAKTAAEGGWANPAMDAYDHYDEHRRSS